MKKIHIKQMLLLILVAIMLLNPMHVSAALLKKGSYNNEVKKVQTALKQLGFFAYPKVTGYYGSITVKAVKKFQRENGLAADGIVGSKTRKALLKINQSKETQPVKTQASEAQPSKTQTKETQLLDTQTVKTLSTQIQSVEVQAIETKTAETQSAEEQTIETKATETQSEEEQTTEEPAAEDSKTDAPATGTQTRGDQTLPKPQIIGGALDWFKKVQYIWKKGTNATITDVDTGKTFKVKRTYGHNHADVEPLTKKDSKIIKNIWNGWSWERRAVIVNVNGTILAGSMTAMPHAGIDSSPANKIVSSRSGDYGRGYNLDAIKNNGASGVMDIHFLNSKTHSSNRVLKSQQDMVKKAGRFLKKLLS